MVPCRDTEAVVAAIGIVGTVETLVGSPPGAFYRVCGERSLPSCVFVRRVTKQRLGSFRYATALARWLADHGVSTNPVVSEHSCLDGSGDIFAVSPYVDWRPPSANQADAERLGEVMAHLHETLAVHPDRARWEETTRLRVTGLSKIRKDVASGVLDAAFAGEAVHQICSRCDADFNNFDLPSVPLHGDPHSFNLLMHRDGSGVTLIDFEDVFHSVLPAVYDLAVIVERVFLVQEQDNQVVSHLIDKFLYSYGIHDRTELLRTKQAIPDVLRVLAVRAFCVLVDAAKIGVDVPRQEWDKFLVLFRQVERREHVFLD